MRVKVVRDGSLTWWYLTKETEMPHSDHIDRWQRESEGIMPDARTPEEHIANMRELLDQAERRAKEAELGRAIRRDNARESRYWRKVIWGCDECGMQGQRHHPACSMATDLDLFDTLEEDRGER